MGQDKQELSAQEYARFIVDVISDLKGEDIVLMDLRDVTIISDFFVICTADNERQLKAIVNKITETMKNTHDIKAWHAEGKPSGGWILVDYVDIVIHVFSKEQREYYDLEGLWSDAKVLLRMQ